jgi:translation elongation factor EF-Tu-like GTPase
MRVVGLLPPNPSTVVVVILFLFVSSGISILTIISSLPSSLFAYSQLHYHHVVRELLSFYEFDGDEIEIVQGSALAATSDKDATIGRDSIIALMEAVERSIPTPERDLDKPFLMPVEDTFSISGRGTVVTGRIETGKLSVGDDLEIIGLKEKAKTTCTGK